ncbi:MAG: MBL fold metallo-hydrolase [bacterium]
MIMESKGKISAQFYALGEPALPAYLFVGKDPVLFDAGMTFMGPHYLQNLKAILGDPPRVTHLLLTHSHFDHCGAAPFLKRNIPGLKIAASKLAAEVWQRPTAIQFIQNLSKSMEEKFASLIKDDDVSFTGLEVDLILHDGQEVTLGDGTKIQAIATPGHTKDALSFYLPELKVLIAGEAVGSLDRNFNIRPVFLSSYKDYLQSLAKLQKLDIELLILGHFYCLGGNIKKVLLKAQQATEEFAQRISQELASSNGDQEAVVRKIFKEDYQEKKLILQEERPFLINLAAQVKAVAEGR